MRKINIIINQKVFEAKLLNTPTADAIWNALPIESKVSKWGDEIYFQTTTSAVLEKDARSELEVGDLAYWPIMPAFCVFYGPTPMSINDTPVAAASVNVFGKLKDFKQEELQLVNENDIIRIERSAALSSD